MTATSVALVTGASAGIGAIYADRLGRRGHDLILVARSGERLEEVASRIRRESGVAVETIVADLGYVSGQEEIAQRLRSDRRIEMLINNAGFGSTATMLESDPDRMAQMIDLNVGALVRLAGSAARVFAERGQGAIVNIGSIAALAPQILNAVYSGTKAFVLAFSQGLREELASKNVRIQVVLPGAIATDFWNVSGTPVDALPDAIVMAPEAVVDAALSGFDQGEFVTLPSLPDIADWQAFDDARLALLPNLSRTEPAARYLASRREVAA